MNGGGNRRCIRPGRISGSILLLWSVSPYAAASNMGNGPAAIVVWVLGTFLALIIAFIFSSTRDEFGALKSLNKSKFFVLLFFLLPVVFVAGVLAIFT